MPIVPTLRQETAKFLEEYEEWLCRLEALRLAMKKEDYENAEWMEGTREFLAAAKLLMSWMLEEFNENDLFELTLREAIRRVQS